ncbi:hypothetical protein VTI28DRAFT_5517 [Corynascus sepedonium]
MDYLDLEASGIYSSPSKVPPQEECGVALAGWDLVFPNARFARQPGGEAACEHVRLVYKNLPARTAVTVIAVELSGYASLDQGAFLDRAEVGVGYFPGPGSDSTELETDVAVDADLASSYSGVYDGTFNLTLNVFPPEGSSRTTRARTSCATAEKQPEMEVSFSLSSSHDGADNGVEPASTISDVRFGFHVMWDQCD